MDINKSTDTENSYTRAGFEREVAALMVKYKIHSMTMAYDEELSEDIAAYVSCRPFLSMDGYTDLNPAEHWQALVDMLQRHVDDHNGEADIYGSSWTP